MKHTYYGDPILRKRAKPVTEITDEIRKFMHEFAEYAISLNALGMAAPQVGMSQAIIVLRIPICDEKGEIVSFQAPRIIINPKLSNPSKERWKYREGNYVLPGIECEVERPRSITISGQNIDGTYFEETLKDLPARIAMHENDHLNGVLFIDRIPTNERKALEPVLRNIQSVFSEKYS